MTERFVSAETVASAYLDANTPLGLFVSTSASGTETKFWVVDHEGRRNAIVLQAERADPFQIWELNVAATAWRGLAIGAVNLEVDVHSGESAGHDLRSAGDITSDVDGVMIHVQVPNQFETLPIRVWDSLAGPETAPGANFRNWRLVQRPLDEPLSVLFERRQPSRR